MPRMHMTTRIRETPLVLAERLAYDTGASLDLLHTLYTLHQRQWQLEDACRNPAATAEQVAAVKRAIDVSNTRRHRLIDALDASIAPAKPTDDGRRYTETVGEVCDRLLILELKLKALPDRPDIQNVCSHLSAALDQLTADLAAQRAILPPRFGTKIYKASEPTPDEDGDDGH